MSNTLKLIIAITIPLLIGFSGSFFTISEIDSWYQTIQKPSWNPPNWIFGPVWTTLYILMGIAFFVVWKSQERKEIKRTAIFLFLLQLVLNFFWSIIFFDQHQIAFAFARISKRAAWLLIPYISWVSFATILNLTIWQLNN